MIHLPKGPAADSINRAAATLATQMLQAVNQVTSDQDAFFTANPQAGRPLSRDEIIAYVMGATRITLGDMARDDRINRVRLDQLADSISPNYGILPCVPAPH